MTCPTADRLRLALYLACQQFTGGTFPLADEQRREILAQRERETFQQALLALQDHFKECETCRSTYGCK